MLVRGQPVNHVLHAFLTVFTCFVWGGVWAVLALTNGVERVVLTVDAQGQVVTVGGALSEGGAVTRTGASGSWPVRSSPRVGAAPSSAGGPSSGGIP